MRLIDADEFFRNYPELAVEPYINAPTVDERQLGMTTQNLNKVIVDAYQKGLNDRSQGKWVKGNAYYHEYAHSMFVKCKCSICGRTQSFYENDETGELYYFDFCPNCGAKMKGGAE